MKIKRFQDDFCAIAQCGVLANGGVTRLALSTEDLDARLYLVHAMRKAHLSVTIDAVGNIRGVRSGQRRELAPVMIGSHLDTVPDGGHYDGVVGVLAALEVVRSLDDAGIETARSIEVINFCAEESSRFGMATVGSKAITGKLNLNDIKKLNDSDGRNYYQILKELGYAIDALDSQIIYPQQLHAFVELHIEQGPVLEAENCDIGIVSAIAAPSRFRVEIRGRSDHSGNTPMPLRRDALAGAAQIILGVEALVRSATATVATVGELTVHPGAMNVVPGLVKLGIDIRDINSEDKEAAIARLNELLLSVANQRQLEIQTTRICHDRPVQLDEGLSRRICEQARQLGLSYKTMASGAGHDAMNMATVAPSALIFIPSIQGISHNIAEKSTLPAIGHGIELLYQTVLELAQES